MLVRVITPSLLPMASWLSYRHGDRAIGKVSSEIGIIIAWKNTLTLRNTDTSKWIDWVSKEYSPTLCYNGIRNPFRSVREHYTLNNTHDLTEPQRLSLAHSEIMKLKGECVAREIKIHLKDHLKPRECTWCRIANWFLPRAVVLIQSFYFQILLSWQHMHSSHLQYTFNEIWKVIM